MASFKNTQGITTVRFKGRYRAYCPLGKKYYSGTVYVKVENPENIPDYCDVDKFFESLDGTDVIIEDAVQKTFDYVVSQVSSGTVTVSCYVEDAAHGVVEVEKSSLVAPITSNQKVYGGESHE